MVRVVLVTILTYLFERAFVTPLDHSMNRNSIQANVDPNKFVNALGWDQLRKSVAQRESLRKGNRNASLAAAWSDVDCNSLDNIPTPGDSERFVLRDLVTSSYPVTHLSCEEWQPMLSEVVCRSVDEFFSYYDDMMEPTVSEPIPLELESENEMDLELSILESVQDISIEICRAQQSQQTTENPLKATKAVE
jgi:hypothetical protein